MAKDPSPIEILIALGRAIGLEFTSVSKDPTGGLYVIRDGGKRVGMIRDEWAWRNAGPPPPRQPPE